MRCDIFSAADYQTSSWSGGETTQIYLHPPGADYAARNFAFRISSATVELESSDFTPLPGIFRHIMLLEGEMRLVHDRQREVRLAPYETDAFAGGQETKSYGRCVDFNLMLAPGWSGSMRAVYSPDKLSCVGGYTGLYARTDGLAVTVRSESGDTRTHVLNKSDFLLIESNDNENVRIEVKAPQRGIAAVLVTAGSTNYTL